MEPRISKVDPVKLIRFQVFFWRGETVIEEEGLEIKALHQEMIISLLFKRLKLSD